MNNNKKTRPYGVLDGTLSLYILALIIGDGDICTEPVLDTAGYWMFKGDCNFKRHL